MEQKSDVEYRAEKEYKNSREKFYLLLREIISNSIHAVLIRQNKQQNYNPRISLVIEHNETMCSIKLEDNGEGFNKKNSDYFEKLDVKNQEKEKLNFHPLGQGRLAIIYFSDNAYYETVYKDEDSIYKKRTIYYPFSTNQNLFEFGLFGEEIVDEDDSYTILNISISSQQKLGRANTFFNKYKDIKSIKNWFIETFFPFIITNDKLEFTISYNGEKEIIKKESLVAESESEDFSLLITNNENVASNYDFKLWLINSSLKIIKENQIICFARNLRSELSGGKLSYVIENDKAYQYYLTSNYFDENVDTKGERIEISDSNVVTLINDKITEVLDKRFSNVISHNIKQTKKTFDSFKKDFPSLETFIDTKKLDETKIIISREDFIKSAIEEKGQIEKKFWNNIKNDNQNEKKAFEESDDCQKLLNSSLQIYVRHRERVLEQLHQLIQKFDSDGNDKPELERKVHDLFFRKGNTLSQSDNINHLHNLWILDDKFTTFSSNFFAMSTKTGQALSDIYIWADDPEKTKQVLILELKSITKAYNAGKSDEGMIAQVKRYARDFYKNPKASLNWDVDTNKIQYTAIILANKADINKELDSNNSGSDYKEIPFLNHSYYKDDNFTKGNGNPRDKLDIRIELYSFEDIYELAQSRNTVFFKLLKKEFEVSDEKE